MNNAHDYPQYYSGDELSESDSEEDELLENTPYKEISNTDNKLGHKLIEKYFNKKSLLEPFKYLRPSYNKVIDSAKKIAIETNLMDLKKDIKNMSDDEVNEKIHNYNS